jgi:hypothetical protein
LFLRNTKALSPPDPSDTLVVHVPSVSPEQSGHSAIAIAAILLSQLDDGTGQRLLTGTARRLLPLGRAVLADHLARTAF